MAVRRGARDEGGGDGAARAGAVLHHHGLAQHALERRGDGARGEVGLPAGRERHDEGERPRREVLRPSGAGGRPGGGHGGHAGDQAATRDQRAGERPRHRTTFSKTPISRTSIRTASPR